MSILYHTSGGSTEDMEAVSTTWSGCLMPTFTVGHEYLIFCVASEKLIYQNIYWVSNPIQGDADTLSHVASCGKDTSPSASASEELLSVTLTLPLLSHSFDNHMPLTAKGTTTPRITCRQRWIVTQTKAR
ncbi:hypothetical protein E2C01_013995 [Portunus trituberculatus]|uniref:Uncharacterized protein n=1 Tax=Portunus trituberculatus TaxID=210409 RepID=A0A5B7DHM6_PORTR|nr:hypothetical protein [Portunus trituberculatus]